MTGRSTLPLLMAALALAALLPARAEQAAEAERYWPPVARSLPERHVADGDPPR